MTRSSAAAAMFLAAASLAAAPRLPDRPTAQEARGKQIYLHGESPGGKPITALMGDGGVEVPATIVPCASCHGSDARGRDEAGVRPSNLRWDVLTRPYKAPGERSHPPYTPSAIKRAVTMGLDPAGHKLQTAMPRYRMSLAQIDDLIAYLQKLPQDSDPGLTDDAVRIGVVIPEGEHAADAKKLVEAYIRLLNRAGGIFGRTIEVRFAASPLQTFIDTEHPFAIAASSLIGNEEEYESVVDLNQIPSMATIATREPRGHYSFHVLAGIREQAVALAEYATRRGAQHPSIVFEDKPPWRDIAAEVKIQPSASPDALIVLGPESLQRETLRTAAMSDHPPLVLIPGSIAISLDDLPATLDHRAAIAVPLLPSDASPAAIAELHALGDDSLSPSITGPFISLQLLIEAIRRAGRDLGREKLIDTLEGFYNVESGLTPKVTFGPNRHTGTGGGHVLVWGGREKTFAPD
jgi:ABC-type branched-subunit amino acid transport system substrate-binding protein